MATPISTKLLSLEITSSPSDPFSSPSAPGSLPLPLTADGMPRLPAEVWAQILVHLRRPLPLPNGRNHPSSVRQTDLTVAMRVSKVRLNLHLFNVLTARLLYSTAVVDDLPLFAYNLGSPPAAIDIPSKTDLVACTRHLCLEYGDIPIPTYLQLMQLGRKVYPLVSLDKDYEEGFRQREAEAITEAAKRLRGIVSPDHISSAMYLGAQGYASAIRLPDGTKARDPTHVIAARSSMSNMICLSKTFNLCQRINNGPLTYLTIQARTRLDCEKAQCPRRHSVYLNLSDLTHALPSALGGPTDYFFSSDRDDDMDIAREREFLRVFGVIRYWLQARETRGNTANLLSKKSLRFSLSFNLYVPAAWFEHLYWPCTPSNFPALIRSYYLELGIEQSQSPGDSFRLRKMEEAPPCTTCGWDKDIV